LWLNQDKVYRNKKLNSMMRHSTRKVIKNLKKAVQLYTMVSQSNHISINLRWAIKVIRVISQIKARQPLRTMSNIMKKNLNIINHNHIIKLSKAFIMITMSIIIMRNKMNLSYQRSNQPKSRGKAFRINQSLNLLITIKSHITLIIIMRILSLTTHLKN
jgi:hypothetical protein